MSEETTTNVSVTKPSWLSQIRLGIRSLVNSAQTLTERIVHIMRSLAMLLLFAMLAFVIISAIENRNTIVVKPFKVSPQLSKAHQDAGIIIANLLKQQLQTEHTLLYQTITPHEQQGQYISAAPLVSMEQHSFAGGDLKLPETGITINHIIDFISGVFGREDLKGMVYEEQGKLHVQIELKGHIINFSENGAPKEAASSVYFSRLEQLFKQHSQRLLSATSDDFSLYYYCTKRITINQSELPRNETYHSLLQLCSKVYGPDIKPIDLKSLHTRLLNQFTTQFNRRNDPIAYATIQSLTGIIENKRQLFCRSGQLTQAQRQQACENIPIQTTQATTSAPIAAVVVPEVVEEETKSLKQQVESIVLSLNPVINSLPPDNFVEQKQPLAEQSHVAEPTQTTPKPPQTLTQSLIDFCNTSPQRNTLESNRLEENATQLSSSGLYTEAVKEYRAAIQANCQNPFAWANLGILLTTANAEKWQQYDQAQIALKQAMQYNQTAGWIRHSLCIAEAYARHDQLEAAINHQSCHEARRIEPANTTLYDKRFYLAVADRYYVLGKAQQAFQNYERATNFDKKRGCLLYKSLANMKKLGTELAMDKTQLQNKICQIHNTSYPSETQECAQELNQLACKLPEN